MNIPFKAEPTAYFIDEIGNAGNGGTPNPPTIPNQKPGTFHNQDPNFVIGRYNNQLESYHFPRFTQYWKNPNQKMQNPVDPFSIAGTDVTANKFGGPLGNAGDGGNNLYFGAGFTPSPFAPYDISQLGGRAGVSQTFPYNQRAVNLEGVLLRPAVYSTMNVNEGVQGDVETGDAEIQKQILMAEMGAGHQEGLPGIKLER